MSYNNIFNDYAKRMIEKGLVKNDQAPIKIAAKKEEALKSFKTVAEAMKETKQLKEYRNSDYPRAGSDSIERIEGLYNTHPERPKSQEYEHNIMEVAHPNKVILNPAYDKINALIENNNERQRIMVNIVMKPTNGLLTQHKYAEADLAQSLVAIANDLDNRNIAELSKLADECIEELHKKAFQWSDLLSDIGETGKGVGAGTILGGIAGGLIGAFGGPITAIEGVKGGAFVGSVLGGVLSSILNTSPQAKNVAFNAREAKSQLGDLLEDHKGDLFLTSLDSALTKTLETATSYAASVDQMHMKSEDAGSKAAAGNIAVAYQTQLQELDRLIDIFLTNAKMGKYTPEESSTWSKVKEPFQAIFGDEVGDAVKAFEALETVNLEALKGIARTREEASGAKTAVESMPAASNALPTAPATTSKPSERSYEDWMKMLSPGE